MVKQKPRVAAAACVENPPRKTSNEARDETEKRVTARSAAAPGSSGLCGYGMFTGADATA
eukprot:398859-Prymnesium_polylepis.1